MVISQPAINRDSLGLLVDWLTGLMVRGIHSLTTINRDFAACRQVSLPDLQRVQGGPLQSTPLHCFV